MPIFFYIAGIRIGRHPALEEPVKGTLLSINLNSLCPIYHVSGIYMVPIYRMSLKLVYTITR